MSVYNRLYVKTELYANKVDGTDLSTSDWEFLGTVDQNLAKANEVEFKSVTLNNASFTTKIQTGATGNYTLTLPVNEGANGEVLTTNGAGILSWNSTGGGGGFDQNLDTTDDVQFNNLILAGDLTVQGTTTMIETTNLEIKDNIIVLNKGDTGAGVSLGTAGIEIVRGPLETDDTDKNQQLLFVESSDTWTVGLKAGVLGTDVHRLAELGDASQTRGAIPGYDEDGRFDESEGLTDVEVDQLQNIDSVTITNTQWAYLGNMNQGVSTTSNVTFNDVTFNGNINLGPGVVITESISAVLTADPAPVVDGITITDTSGGSFAATLPDNSSSAGKYHTIVLKTAGNDLTVTAAGSDMIVGNTTMVLNVQGQHIRLCSLGNGDWIIV
jgi:hypothetical protein